MTGRPWTYSNDQSLVGNELTRQFVTTREKYEDPLNPGHYHAEREQRHALIIKRALKGKESAELPYALFIGGGPTSGKSTVTAALRKRRIIDNQAVVINKGCYTLLPEFHDAVSARHPEKTVRLLDEYYDIQQYLVEAAIEKRLSIIVEDHFDYFNLTKHVFDMTKNSGYETALIGMTTDVETYFVQEAERCKRDNKKPDHHWSLILHRIFSDYWEKYAELVDIAVLYRRNSKGPPLTNIATAIAGNAQQIHDRSEYEQFQKWQHVNTNAKNPTEAFPEGIVKQSNDERRGVERGTGGSKEAGDRISKKGGRIIDNEMKFVQRIKQFGDTIRDKGK